MGFLSDIVSPFTKMSKKLGNAFGISDENLFSGIPFIGQGFAADKANAFSAQQMSASHKFQNYMSSTAHQREQADLKKAGLNPILSATGGAGAPSGPGGS